MEGAADTSHFSTYWRYCTSSVSNAYKRFARTIQTTAYELVVDLFGSTEPLPVRSVESSEVSQMSREMSGMQETPERRGCAPIQLLVHVNEPIIGGAKGAARAPTALRKNKENSDYVITQAVQAPTNVRCADPRN
jgi:hypothetical protein